MTRIYVHPLPVRIWHWVNALGFVALILTGFQIRYADVLHAVPFAIAVNVHNSVGFVLLANYFVWLCFYLFTDSITVYHPELRPKVYFRHAIRQALYYGYGIFRGAPNPHRMSAERKFNALQSTMYQIIMILLVPIQFYTGLLLWNVDGFAGSIAFLGGLRVVATVHVCLFIFFTAFLFGHVYLASLGHTTAAHFKAMLTGYEEVEEHRAKAAE